MAGSAPQDELCIPHAAETSLSLQIEVIGKWQFGRDRQQQDRILSEEQEPFARQRGAAYQRASDNIGGKRRDLRTDSVDCREAPGSPSREAASTSSANPSPSQSCSCTSAASRIGGVSSSCSTCHPASASRRPASSTAAATSSTICNPPGRRHSAARSGTGGPSNGAGTHQGSRGSGADITPRAIRRSSIVRAIGPVPDIS
jgi:hypothetical protein